MFSVLIVDDEEPVLSSYEFMINAFSENEFRSEVSSGEDKSPFTLAGKARNGFEALRMINETEPDIVFMDINIPGIDGLTVLEDISKKYPRMILILSTAYERFDLARRAIPLGVFAYLVKPVSRTTFFSTLENALKQLLSKPPENPEYTEPALALFRRDIRLTMDEQRWNWYREKLSLPSDYGAVLIVELGQEQDLWGSRIAEEISYKHHCIFDVILNRALFLISGIPHRAGDNEQRFASGDININEFRNKTGKMLERLLTSVSYSFGLGGLYKGHELNLSYEEALKELTGKRYKTEVWYSIAPKISNLRQKFGLLPPEEIKSLFTGIWEPLFSEDFNTAKLRMVCIFTMLLDDLYGYWSNNNEALAPGEGADLPFDPAEIMELENIDAWKYWIEASFDKLLEKANIIQQGSFPQPLVRALAFIRDNYTQSIQLSDVAEAALVNTAHLSRLFSEHLKTNYVDYLTAMRINEAERLLKETSISVKEAAFATGYQDPNYFSKLFKKVKGILPTEAAR